MSVDTLSATGQTILQAFYQHNLWANLHLFDACLALSDAQLDHSDRGTYGSIRATLTHLVRSEERYLSFLTRQERSEAKRPDTQPTIIELKQRVLQSGQALIRVVGSMPPDAQVQVGNEENAELIPAKIVLLQTIYHSNEHRTHVATLLGQLGLALPPLSGWDFYDEEMLEKKLE